MLIQKCPLEQASIVFQSYYYPNLLTQYQNILQHQQNMLQHLQNMLQNQQNILQNQHSNVYYQHYKHPSVKQTSFKAII